MWYVAISLLAIGIISLFAAIIAHIFSYKNAKQRKSSYIAVALDFLAVIGFLFSIALFFVAIPMPEILPLDNEIASNSEREIIINSKNKLLSIYFTTDGTDPKSGKEYEEPFTIDTTTTVSARAKFLMFWSDIEKSNYTINSTGKNTSKIENNGEKEVTDEVLKGIASTESLTNSSPKTSINPTSKPTQQIMTINPTSSLKEKKTLDEIKNTRRADFYAMIMDTTIQIKTNTFALESCLGDIIKIKPSKISLINMDYNIDCSKYVTKKDDITKLDCFVFEKIIPGNYRLHIEYPGFQKYIKDICLNSVDIFNDKWRHTHHLMSLTANSFYPVSLIILNESMDPQEGVEYAVKYLKNEPYRVLGNTNEMGNAEYSMWCGLNSEFYLQLNYNGHTYEKKIQPAKNHNAHAFQYKNNGTFIHLVNFYD